MSVLHYTITKQPLNAPTLNQFISSTIKDVVIEKRSENVYYYWIKNKSTRGFDITIENNSIEVRNTMLSNYYDYKLTNRVVSKMVEMTQAIVLDEEEEQVNASPLFSQEQIVQMQIDDCKTLQNLSAFAKDLAIYSPVRKVYFGQKTHHQFQSLNEKEVQEKIFSTILKVNYQIPNFEYGNILEMRNEAEEQKILKLLTNKSNYIIAKYDYILLHTENQNPIVIDNDILNSILPPQWQLVDEFNIVAPILPNKEWIKLQQRASPYDLWNELMN